jgi:hypothetical protein
MKLKELVPELIVFLAECLKLKVLVTNVGYWL